MTVSVGPPLFFLPGYHGAWNLALGPATSFAETAVSETDFRSPGSRPEALGESGSETGVRGSESTSVSCSLVALSSLTAHQIEQWRDLASRSLEKNAFLCPEFVLPSLGLTDDRRPPLVLIAEEVGGDNPNICGLGVFEAAGPTAKFPMPYLRAYRSPHSFLTGLLIREDAAMETVTEMMRYLVFGPHRWKGVRFSDIPRSGAQAELLNEACSRLDAIWYTDFESRRAVLNLRPESRDHWKEHVSYSRVKDIRRCRRKLEALGEVEWRFVGEETGEAQIEAYLRLEHLGWKSGAGTSLRSLEHHERFFRSLIKEFHRVRQVFFTELLLDGVVIASVSSLCVGDQGFGFKTAFDPRYADMGPSFINEYEFLEALERVPGLTDLDSGAQEGSYIDELWPGRRALGTGFYVGRRGAKWVVAVVDFLRKTRRRILRGHERRSTAT
jgi:Acetyltransferase (GNAT) domain